MAGKRSRPYTVDDVEFVYDNYAKMTASEIADKLGISKFQVSKIVGELRKHMELPKKTIQRPNPIFQFLEKRGVSPKTSTKESKASKSKK
ncbi:MAG: MarR family transcriptional regulator [Dissulfurimicrobium sp.]|uniref:MarR family transcriptional regulator n=1 Tax=Dissulfurimicrobium TaxID=1769732 RepID=UPI001EDA7B93|nr:helix-turn-helix domain-containing protein [Dissulfurimicrobium hydrothermale]UKL13925.1 MarR family transcriptional regulator [Dissulfurimicrobium hydrothermale]